MTRFILVHPRLPLLFGGAGHTKGVIRSSKFVLDRVLCLLVWDPGSKRERASTGIPVRCVLVFDAPATTEGSPSRQNDGIALCNFPVGNDGKTRFSDVP